MNENNPRRLTEEIRRFRQNKTFLGLILIAVGLLGILLPILPGLLVIGMGLWLLFPRQADRLLDKLRTLF